MTRRYRVAQWATGNIGSRALRGVIEHPALDLVAVHVHDDTKAGLDAGTLCGTLPTGILACTDLASVITAQPECVLYMPLALDLDELCRLLAAGINVVTTRGELLRPASMPVVLRERVEAACAAGGASVHSTGSSPGFITEAFPLVVTSLQRRLESLAIEEFADLSRRESPALLFEVMGFGQDPEAIDPRRLQHGITSFGPSLELVADALGLPLDAVEAEGEVAVAANRTEIAAGVIEPGTVAAQRTTVLGIRAGRPLLTFRATWYCTKDLATPWDLRDTGWRVIVDGDAPLDIDLRFPIPLDDMASFSPAYTANRAVNAVPAVCEAPAGICTTVDLPQLIATLGQDIS